MTLSCCAGGSIKILGEAIEIQQYKKYPVSVLHFKLYLSKTMSVYIQFYHNILNVSEVKAFIMLIPLTGL